MSTSSLTVIKNLFHIVEGVIRQRQMTRSLERVNIRMGPVTHSGHIFFNHRNICTLPDEKLNFYSAAVYTYNSAFDNLLNCVYANSKRGQFCKTKKQTCNLNISQSDVSFYRANNRFLRRYSYVGSSYLSAQKRI